MTPSVFGSTVLVQGAEPLLAERAVKSQVSRARREQLDAELYEVAAGELADGQFGDLIGGSLFATHSIVVLNDLANLPEEALPLVRQTALAPPPELCLILVHAGGVKGKALVDALKKAKVPVVRADPLKQWELATFVAGEARGLRMRMDDQTGQAVVDAVGSDLRAISGALRQLSADYEGQQVSAAMVGRYFGGRAEVSSFAVADDVLAGRSAAALEKLRWALSTGVAPVLVTSALANSLRGLGKYLELRSARLPEPEVARQAGVPVWKLKELSRLSRDWSSGAVSVAIRAVAKADEQVKGAATNPGFALEQLLLTIGAAREQSRQR